MDGAVMATLSLWRRSSFVWGETDCMMATCNHVRDLTGIDPAAPWRGSYHDEEGAKAIYEAYGGVLGLAQFSMARAGFSAGERAPGRPVICEIAGHQIAGVDMGGKVMFMSERPRGVVCLRAQVLQAWSV